MRRFVLFVMAVCVLGSVGHAQYFNYTVDSQVTSMLQASDGNLYGINGDGFFQLTPGLTYSVLNPSLSNKAVLCLEAADGTLLANTADGGGSQISRVTLAGQATVVATLPVSESDTLPCPVIASDGNYYGGYSGGGAYNSGFLYQLTPSGTLSVFYNFTGTVDGNGPAYSLVQGSDGNLYGLAGKDFFRYSPSLGLTVLYNPGAIIATTDGPLEGPDGNYYAFLDNVAGLSRITPSGSVSTIPVPTPGGQGGAYYQALFLGGDDRFYVQEIQDDVASCGDDDVTNGSYVVVVPVAVDGTAGPILFTEGEAGYGEVTGQLGLGGNGYFYAALTSIAYQDTESGICQPTITYSIAAPGAPTTPPAPLALSFSKTHVLPGGNSTLSWQLNNGFSKTMQQCYAYGGWMGKQATSGTMTVSAPTAGTYPYSLVCGGVETSIATLTAGDATLTSSATPTTVASGSPVTLTAQITNAGTPAPTGSVKFLYGSRLLGSGALNSSGAASFTASSTGIPPGTYNIVASYAGDANYGPATAPPVAVSVIAKSKTVLALSTTTPNIVAGQAASVSATATGTLSGYAPAGNVSFHYGSLSLGDSALQSTGATTSTTTFSASSDGVPPGTYSVTASYPGDAWNLAATSNAVTITVSAGDKVAVAVSPNPVPTGDGFTLTATVSGKSTPAGTVIFYAGTQALGSNSLNGSGVASVQVPAGTLTAGSYSVTAYYAGDKNNPADTSPAITLVVQ